MPLLFLHYFAVFGRNVPAVQIVQQELSIAHDGFQLYVYGNIQSVQKRRKKKYLVVGKIALCILCQPTLQGRNDGLDQAVRQGFGDGTNPAGMFPGFDLFAQHHLTHVFVEHRDRRLSGGVLSRERGTERKRVCQCSVGPCGGEVNTHGSLRKQRATDRPHRGGHVRGRSDFGVRKFKHLPTSGTRRVINPYALSTTRRPSAARARAVPPCFLPPPPTSRAVITR